MIVPNDLITRYELPSIFQLLWTGAVHDDPSIPAGAPQTGQAEAADAEEGEKAEEDEEQKVSIVSHLEILLSPYQCLSELLH